MGPQHERQANSGDPATYLKRVENLLDDLERIRGEYRECCKEVRNDIKLVYTEAQENGVTVKSLKALIQYRDLERKQDQIAETLDLDERATYENLVMTLGDLGRAALIAPAI